MCPRKAVPADSSQNTPATLSGTVVSYLRVSTSKDQTVATQRSAIARAGYKVTKEFADEGVSGRKASRPGLDACLAWLREGDTLVIFSLSRLGRNTVATLQLLDELSERGVVVHSITEDINTSGAMGRFVVTLLAALANLEADLVRERTLAGLARAAEEGRFPGRPRAVPPEMVGELFRLRAQGVPMPSICEQLGVSRSSAYRALSQGN